MEDEISQQDSPCATGSSVDILGAGSGWPTCISACRSKTEISRVSLRLFDYDPVRPFDQRYKNRRIAKFCSPIFQVCFRDPTGPGTGTSSKDRNAFGYDV